MLGSCKIFNADELAKAIQDPGAAVRMLLENPLIRRMVLESLRKVLEPVVIASNLTWLIFRSAFDMITEPEQIEACVQNPHDFFAYMLKKVRKLSVGQRRLFFLPVVSRHVHPALMQIAEL